MAATPAQGGKRTSRPRRPRRTAFWLVLLGVGVVALAAVLWSIVRGAGGGIMDEGGVPLGQRVEAVQLEDSRTGQMFDLGQFVGKRDTVVVAYMGEFCLGCSELVAELQQRAPEFEAADASLVVLGSETGQMGRNTAMKHGVTAYPLLQESAPYPFMRSIGMWSDMMRMPFMGYVIIDKSGTIIAGEQASLSEARGAAPANVDQILSALTKAREASRNSASDIGASGQAVTAAGAAD